jgi:hypothetical protein
MCSYLSCDPSFASEVNIIYSTTIQKIISSAQVWKGQLNQMNASSLGGVVSNGSMTHFIDLIYYSEMTIRLALENVIYLYLNCFTTYSNNLMLKKQTVMGIALAITILTLGSLICLILYVIRHQGFLRDIAGLVKTESYINEDNQIADKEAGRPAS